MPSLPFASRGLAGAPVAYPEPGELPGSNGTPRSATLIGSSDEARSGIGEALGVQSKVGIGVSEPHWIGGPTRYLYAALHRASVPDAKLAVLLVPPLFHEQSRSRRLLTEVASGLAATGLPTMRFDFFGTGDSAGDSDQVDFTSMCFDLEIATSALRLETGVERVAVIAWRGASLPVTRWLREGGHAALVILWEPVLDGSSWLMELECQDAAERCSPDRYRLRRRPVEPSADQQLMGMAVSPRLRSDIAGMDPACHALAGNHCWAVLRPGSPQPSIVLDRVFDLPADSPTFGGSTRMDSGLFVTPRLKQVADELGRALVESG